MMSRILFLFFVASMSFAGISSAQDAPPQKLRTVEYMEVYKDWEDFDHWYWFVKFSDAQNKKAVELMKEDLGKKIKRLHEEHQSGSISDKDFEVGQTYAKKRANELISFEKVQEEITDIRLREGKAEREERIEEEVEELARKEGYDYVLKLSDGVIFSDPNLSVSEEVAETINLKDKKEGRRMMEERLDTSPTE